MAFFKQCIGWFHGYHYYNREKHSLVSLYHFKMKASDMLDVRVCERARLARDARFDGLFFTGVLSTGIFCRPICPAPTPKAVNVVYFPTAAAAVAAGLRPCKRCRPDAAPGTPAWRGSSATVARAIHLIQREGLDHGSLEALASRLGVGGRHLRRLFRQHVGATPTAMARCQRVMFAKNLLEETTLSITHIAFACGFGSIRRFNAAFKSICQQTPTAFRKRLGTPTNDESDSATFKLTLTLPYRPPYQWRQILEFFRLRAVEGVEAVDSESYCRTVRYPGGRGWIILTHAPQGHALLLKVALSNMGALVNIVAQVRRMFDLDANVPEIAAVLSADKRLKPFVASMPGLPLAGVWDPFETAVRAIVGQQISVKAARTIVGRIVARIGHPVDADEKKGLKFLFPDARDFVEGDMTALGLTAKRAETLKEMARRVLSGRLELSAAKGLDDFVGRLILVPGVGPWTAHYIALRALGEPDAFPSRDLGIAEALARNGRRPTHRQIEKRAEKWRPWRAYAANYLWNAKQEINGGF